MPAPARHCHVMTALWKMNPDITIKPSQQGFITNRGLFVDRVSAKLIAQVAGQILPGKDTKHKELFSEDLW